MLSYYVIIGICVMLLMAMSVVIVAFLLQRSKINHQMELQHAQEQKQFELLQASLQSEEEERQRIAGELHDDVGATLASIRLFLHQAEKQSGSSAILQQSGELVDQTLKKVRDISHKMQPATLQALGLFSALQAFSDLYRNSAQLKMEVAAEQEIPRLDPHAELHLYRIVQELTSNAVRHSGARQISIRMGCAHSILAVYFYYDGIGISQPEFDSQLLGKTGMGLKSMANRIRFVNGKISFQKNTNGLHLVTITVPTTTSL